MINRIFQINFRGWLTFLIPLAMAVLAAWGVDQYLVMQKKDIEDRAKVPEVIRVVAIQNLSKGTVIGVEHLATRAIPKNWADVDTFEVDQAYELEGMILQKNMVSGQPFSAGLISAPASVALTSRLKPGRRALTIPVDHINAMSGLLQPGDSIDLFVTFEHEGKRVTSLLVSAVQVLATDQKLTESIIYDGDQAKQFSSVTLDVSPTEAIKLVSARQDGILTAVLRVDHGLDAANGVQSSKVPTGHLAGFVGVDTSFGQPKPVNVIYGDLLNGFDFEEGSNE
jgi:pilus assembly protein CpaB